MRQHVIETIDPRALGRRLQEARKARGITQQEVAESLAVARTTVTALEKGERRPRPDELIQMARLYGRSVGDSLGPKSLWQTLRCNSARLSPVRRPRMFGRNWDRRSRSFKACAKTTCILRIWLRRHSGATTPLSIPLGDRARGCG